METLTEVLELIWRKKVGLRECSYYWMPGTKIAFCISDKDRTEGQQGRLFEKKFGKCFCFLSSQIVNNEDIEKPLMIEMMQSIIRDGVDPLSVGKALCQVMPYRFSLDTIHAINHPNHSIERAKS